MKFKIFAGTNAPDLEKQVNEWLEKEKALVKTSGCAMAHIPAPFTSMPSYLVSVFYEGTN